MVNEQGICGFESPVAWVTEHLLNTLLGWKINPHFDPLHILSNILIFGGFILLSSAWKALYEAQRDHKLATTGPYAHVHHPQYVGFILIMLGFLFQWPTLVTLAMFPILVTMHVKLARREEQEVLESLEKSTAATRQPLRLSSHTWVM